MTQYIEETTIAHSSLMAPLLRELERIANTAESRRAEADYNTIEELRKEINELRSTVAHLRAASTPLPAHLRPAVARAFMEGAQ